MKCFNHVDREAVATCQSCGKGLCRECASKYRPCLCDECYQDDVEDAEAMKQLKKKAALVDTNSEMLKTVIQGVVVGVALTLVMAKVFGGYGTFEAGDYVGMGLFFFCVPFGWKGITYIESLIPTPRFFTLLVSWYFVVCWVTVKFMLALILGIPLFLFQFIKWIVNLSKISNAKA